MNKKSIILCLAMVILPLLASAHDFTVDGFYYKILSNENKTVAITFKGTYSSDYNDEYQGVLETPSVVKYNNTRYQVVAIDELAFSGCSLTSITISEGITEIGNGAFSQCKKLSAITFAPNSKLTTIGGGTFSECKALSSISIPNGVTSIENGAFNNCSQLRSVIFSENSQLSFIGKYVFSGCSSLTSIELPEKITKIEQEVFNNCSLENIYIPKSVTEIGEWAFAHCYYLKDIFCYADSISIVHNEAFYNVGLENITLHVTSKSIEKYRASSPWNKFGAIEAIKVPVSEIILSQSSATLTEGESITLTATVKPEDADDTSVTWNSSNEDVAIVSSKGKVIAMGVGTAIVTATANDDSGVSASCEIIVKAPLLGKCTTPTINHVNGEIVLTCSTEDAEIRTTATTENDNEYVGTKFEFVPTHTFTAYATKDNYEDSDKVSLTLCWVPCTEEHESEETDILTIPSKPVLIQSQGGVISITGLADETFVVVYDVSGRELATSTIANGTATLSTDLVSGTIAIVKFGKYSVKIRM